MPTQNYPLRRGAVCVALLATLLCVLGFAGTIPQERLLIELSERISVNWKPIVLDMNQQDVLLQSCIVDAASNTDHCDFSYTVSYTKDPASWKESQSDFEPKYFVFNLPIVVSQQLLYHVIDDPASIGIEVLVDGKPLQETKAIPAIRESWGIDMDFGKKKFTPLELMGLVKIEPSESLPEIQIKYRQQTASGAVLFLTNFGDFESRTSDFSDGFQLNVSAIDGTRIKKLHASKNQSSSEISNTSAQIALAPSQYVFLKIGR